MAGARKKTQLDRAEITAARASGRACRAPHVVLHYAPRAAGRAGIAVVVSKKVAATAVERNRLRRRCKAALRERITAAAPPLALVFVMRRGAAALSYAELSGELAKVVRCAQAR